MSKHYYILDPDSPGENTPDAPLRSMSAIGPFLSMREAEDYLCEDYADTYLHCDGSLRDLEDGDYWANPVLIVELKKTVRPIPHVKVTVELRKERNA